jgi:hypothetical protein
MVFDLSAGKSLYPIYDKDSLLNTNPSFDYGEFRRLSELAASSANVTMFGFTFRDAGVYVFYMNGQPDLKTIVSVRRVGERCPGDGAITPITESALVQLGVRREVDIVVAPSWPIIIAVLVAIAVVAALAVAGLYLLQHSSWGTERAAASADKGGYKRAALALQPSQWHSLGAVMSSTLPPPEPSITGPGAVFKGAVEPLTTVAGTAAAGVVGGTSAAAAGRGKATALAIHSGGGVGVDVELAAADIAGAAVVGGVTGLDVDRWGQEDLDLRELLERVEHHHVAVQQALEGAAARSSHLSADVREEFEALRRTMASVLLSLSTGVAPAALAHKLEVRGVASQSLPCTPSLLAPCDFVSVPNSALRSTHLVSYWSTPHPSSRDHGCAAVCAVILQPRVSGAAAAVRVQRARPASRSRAAVSPRAARVAARARCAGPRDELWSAARRTRSLRRRATRRAVWRRWSCTLQHTHRHAE